MKFPKSTTATRRASRVLRYIHISKRCGMREVKKDDGTVMVEPWIEPKGSGITRRCREGQIRGKRAVKRRSKAARLAREATR